MLLQKILAAENLEGHEVVLVQPAVIVVQKKNIAETEETSSSCLADISRLSAGAFDRQQVAVASPGTN